MDGWFFGCDLCQTVCPWNIKLHGKHPGAVPDLASPEQRRARLVEELRMILTSSNSKLLKLFHGTPLVRAGGNGLKRNALLVCGILRLTELQPEIEHLLLGEATRELADYALTRIAFTRMETQSQIPN
jgi:epoxyqueuosine reductase